MLGLFALLQLAGFGWLLARLPVPLIIAFPLSQLFTLSLNIPFTMDPFMISMAVVPLIISTAKAVGTVKDNYKNSPATLVSTSAECI